MLHSSYLRNTALTLFWLAVPICPILGATEDEDSEPDIPAAVARAVRGLVLLQEKYPEGQEGERNQWPYEGVYRVRAYEKDSKERMEIPIGYRVGGTSITACALVLTPGFEGDADRRAAVERAAGFVVASIEHTLMDPEYSGGYDVRAWGYIYALDFLLLLERKELVPKDLKTKVRKAISFYLSGLEKVEIPKSGGWSYSRARSLGTPSATSPFMTGPALQALFAAEDQGHRVKAKLVERAMDALERGRVESGEVVYSSAYGGEHEGGQLPGSVGRMLVTENTLFLGGRGSLSRVRGALDAFLVHWEWLDKRRAKNGTHVKPYGVAPYYFYYAHFQAAQSIEMLPEKERAEYRRRLNERLFSVRQEDGLWNDRVFDRTANYGTSISLRVLTMSESEGPPRWKK